MKPIEFLRNFPGAWLCAFPDNGRGPALFNQPHDPANWAAQEARLHQLNGEGCGIFFTPNGFKKSRKSEDLVQVNAFYADLDSGSKLEQMERMACLPEPSLIVETARGYHIYFLLPNAISPTKEEFAAVNQNRIRYSYEGDPKAADICRLLRLPGFNHAKGRPFPVRVVRANGPKWTYGELQGIPGDPTTTPKLPEDCRPKADPTGFHGRIDNIHMKDALERLSGTKWVNKEVYTFRDEGPRQRILIAGMESRALCWIDPAGHWIAGGGGPGNGGRVIQWLRRKKYNNTARDINACLKKCFGLVEKKPGLNAKLAQTESHENYLYDPHSSQWFEWTLDPATPDGGWWKAIHRDYVAQDLTKKLTLDSESAIRSALRLLSIQDGVTLPKGKKMNGNPEEILLANGVFNTTTHTLRAARREDYNTTRVPTPWDPNATCERWLKFLEESMVTKTIVGGEIIHHHDPGNAALLQEYFGYCLIRSVKHAKALILKGPGNDGKSRVTFVLRAMVGGENCAALDLEKLDDHFFAATLMGKMVNICPEIETGEAVRSSLFKAITTGDTVSASFKFKDVFTFEPYCKQVYAMNELPRTRDKTHAYYRRLLIIPFERKFEPHEEDKSLIGKLLKELPGILAWSIQGLKRLTENDGFTNRGNMDSMLEEYRRDNSSVLQFAEDNLTFQEGLLVDKKELYTAYVNFCREDSGSRPSARNNFFRELYREFPRLEETRTRNNLSGFTRWIQGCELAGSIQDSQHGF